MNVFGTLFGKPKPNKETFYSAQIAKERGGIAEYRLEEDSRVDVLLPDLAIEVEWPEKWTQAVGQAIYYSIFTNRPAGIILLMDGSKESKKYYTRCMVVCQRLNIKLESYRV